MKKLMYLGMTFLLFVACKQGPERFSTSGPEVDLVKKLVDDYEKGDWDAWREAYSDTVKIYHNTRTEAVDANAALERHQETLALMNSYGFLDDPIFYEKIIDDKGKTWVNFWGSWQSELKANAQALETQVHLTLHIKEGKIVEEHGFWDNAPMVQALQQIEAQAKMAEEEMEKVESN